MPVPELNKIGPRSEMEYLRQLGDEYLLSVRVERPAWESIDFHGLKSIDVNEALAQFDLNRDQLKDGSFKAVIPHTVHVGGS